MTSQRTVVSLIISVLIVLTAGCGKGKENNDGDRNGTTISAVVPVQIDTVTSGNAVLSISAVGKTAATRTEKILSPSAGKIVALKVLEGSTVKAGDVLAVMMTKESQAALSGAETLLRSAKTSEQREEAQKSLQLARASQSTITLSARFSGVVASRSVSEGELTGENTEILTLVDLSSIIFLADVSLQDITGVKKGMAAAVEFQSLPGKEFKAVVDALFPQSDVQSQTVQVRLRFVNLTGALRTFLRTGMAGIARIITGIRKHVLFVPASALLRDDENGTFSVVCVTPDSFSRIIPVILGVTTDTMVEVKSSLLKEGIPVIIKGNYALADSTRVTVGRRESK
jgi:multidrug efflux pump subunit AcrA (membrane-fusion protein)